MEKTQGLKKNLRLLLFDETFSYEKRHVFINNESFL